MELALYRLRAYRDERPAVLLVHGAFTGHRVWLRRKFAYFLGERGLDVWAADLRHHGASEREPAPRTWRFEDWVLRDASALVRRIKDETNDAPLAWIGHSSGGAVGLCAAARLPQVVAVQALVTLGTPGPRRSLVVRGAVAAFVAATRALGRFPARGLGMGAEDEAAGLLADWLEWTTRGCWVGRDGYDYWAALRTLQVPYLAVAGGADHVLAPPRVCAQVVDQVGAENKMLAVYPRLGHRGLVLSRRARERAWPALVDWLADALSAQ